MLEKPNVNFIGTVYSTLDEKSRLTIPAKFRELIPGREDSKLLVISKGKERNLDLLTPDYFEWVIEQIGLLPPGSRQRNLMRYYSSESENLKVDRAGRIQMPARFLEWLGVSKDIVVVGGQNRLELWRPDQHVKIMEEAETEFQSEEWQF